MRQLAVDSATVLKADPETAYKTHASPAAKCGICPADGNHMAKVKPCCILGIQV